MNEDQTLIPDRVDPLNTSNESTESNKREFSMEIKIDLESREASDSEIWPLNKPVQNDNISNTDQRGINIKSVDFVLVYSHVQSKNGDHTDQDHTTSKNAREFNNKRELLNIETKRRFYLENLVTNGLKLTEHHDDDENLEFVFVQIPESTALDVAAKMKLKLPIEKMADNGDTSAVPVCGCFTSMKKLESRFFVPEYLKAHNKKRDHFTAPYNSDMENKFKKKTFEAKDRCLLTYEILQRTIFSQKIENARIFRTANNEASDDKVGIERLLADGTFLAAYPLHEDYSDGSEQPVTDRWILWRYWARPKTWLTYQPLHIVRRYFGEKLAFYFSWLGFYTGALLLPSIVGLLVFLYGCLTVFWDKPTNEICDKNGIGSMVMCPLCDNNQTCQAWSLSDSCIYSRITYLVDNPFTVFFSGFMAVWTVVFIEFWKREQSKLQFEWDTHDFEKSNEPVRPEFEIKVAKMGTRRLNRVTGQYEPFVPMRKRLYRLFFSVSVVLLMICLVIALVIGVIAYRVSLSLVFTDKKDQIYASLIASASAAMINLVIIIILSRVYSWVAIKLTDLELHRTDSRYENALTIKMYLFQFVNFYASIFYIAFFKGRKLGLSGFDFFREECNQSGCLSELCIQLAIIMVGKQILNNIQEILYPVLQNYWNRTIAKNRNKNRHHKKPEEEALWKQDYTLMEWSHLTLFDEYLEMVIQYGFITLFVVAFPLGPLFALLNNVMEIRIDAFKVVTQYRRPLPKKAQDIGIWLPILSTISKLGVITNGLIIAFTSEFIPRLVYRFAEYHENNQTISNLYGYVNFTLSKNITIVDNVPTICYYRDFREPYDSPDKFEFTKMYFYVLAARLAFFVIFEHLVFFILIILHCIPDVPKKVQDQIDHENFMIQTTLWNATPDNSSQPQAARISEELETYA